MEDLASYRNLGEFFRRPLKPHTRPVCPSSCVVRQYTTQYRPILYNMHYTVPRLDLSVTLAVWWDYNLQYVLCCTQARPVCPCVVRPILYTSLISTLRFLAFDFWCTPKFLSIDHFPMAHHTYCTARRTWLVGNRGEEKGAKLYERGSQTIPCEVP